MKKLGLLAMSLIAISFLTNCNNGGGEEEKTIPLEECTWEKISEVSKADKASKWFKVGDTKTVKVNNQDHKVRIIGFNQDVDQDGNKIGITFEFVNLISDENGYSLATQWNDTNDDSTANNNYLDSSVRMALVGEKQDEGHILWAQRGNNHWSNEPEGPYTDKSVLDMLPDELTKEGILKIPAKYINIWNKDKKPVAGWEEQVVSDKLFLLSPAEMGRTGHEDEETKTTVYSYYKDAEDNDRIKKQISDDIYDSDIEIPSDSGQTSERSVINCAGYNFGKEGTVGGYSWLRSPCTYDDYHAWSCDINGGLGESVAFISAYAVAPAFCI